MSQRIGSEAESGNAASARKESREQIRPIPKLAVAPSHGGQTGSSLPVEQIGALTAAELAELAPPETRGAQSGAFSKRFGEAQLDWSALRTPTPIPPPPAAEPMIVPSAVQPFYGKLPTESERAELRVADLSLDFANPFMGSSLMPPPPSKRPWLKPLLISVGGCLLIGAGYAGAVLHVERSAYAAVTKWMSAETAPSVSIVVQPPLQAATETSSPGAPEATQAATPTVHAQAHVREAVHTEEQAVEAAALETSAEPAVTAESNAVATTEVTPATQTAHGTRARRHALRAVAPVVEAPSASAKVLEPKPAAPSVTLPAASSAKRAVTPTASAHPASGAPLNPQSDLSRAQVQTGLESVRGELQTCAAGAHGRTTANVTISGAGRVTYATIEGAFAGTPQGSCMARALRGAQFPQFASPQLLVRYPFAL